MTPQRAWAIRTAVVGITLLLLAALFALTVIRPARAHGDAAWIQQSPDFSWCCSERDCAMLPSNGVQEVNGGYLIIETGEVIEQSKANPSPDGEYWRCRTDSNNPVSSTRCFFAPPRGS